MLGINNTSTNNIYDYGLYIIDNILQELGHSLSDWPCMPTLQHQWEQYSLNKMIAEQLNYDHNSDREFQGVRNLQGLRVGYAGVRVGVATFRPSQNPYPQNEGTGFGGFFPRVFKSGHPET